MVKFSLYQLVWMFFVYAFMGWCAEVAFAGLRHGRFVNRGFLNGPICPIYGFGLVGVILPSYRPEGQPFHTVLRLRYSYHGN